MLFLHLFGLLFSLLRLTSAPPADPAPDDPPTERTRATDVLARYGSDVVRMAEKVAELESDLYKTRRSRDDYKRDNDDLKKKAAPDGALVLTGDDASQYQAFKALNLAPDAITAQLTAGKEAADKATKLERAETIRTVATAAGFRPEGLQDFDQLAGGLAYTVKDKTETVRGQQVISKRAYVQLDGKEIDLVEHVKATRPHLLPALTAEPVPVVRSQGTPPRGERHEQQPPATVVLPNIRL